MAMPCRIFACRAAPKPFTPFDAISLRLLFERRQRGDAELLVQLNHLLRTQIGDDEHFQNTRRNLLALRIASSLGWVPVSCRQVTMFAMASPTPGTSRKCPSRVTSASGIVSAPRLSAART